MINVINARKYSLLLTILIQKHDFIRIIIMTYIQYLYNILIIAENIMNVTNILFIIIF